MIALQNLPKLYPPATLALDDCTVTIAAGEFVMVIGPSGSGKSTLLRCINRLISPTGGQVVVDGLDVTVATHEQLRQARRAVGMIFQQFNLIKRATVMDNVLAGRLGYTHPIASLRSASSNWNVACHAWPTFIVRMFPPDFTISSSALRGALQTLEIAVVGTILAALLALPLGFLSARNIAPSGIFYSMRGILNYSVVSTP
jgi:phosphonate transport system ATP-binding protein